MVIFAPQVVRALGDGEAGSAKGWWVEAVQWVWLWSAGVLKTRKDTWLPLRRVSREGHFQPRALSPCVFRGRRLPVLWQIRGVPPTSFMPFLAKWHLQGHLFNCVCVSAHTGGFIKKLQSSNVALFKYTKRLLALRLVCNLRWLQIHEEQAKHNMFWFLSLDFSVVVWKILYNNPDSVQLNWSSNNMLSLALHDIYFTTYLLEGEAICIHKIFICIYDLSSLHGKFTPFLQIMLFTSLKCLCIHNASSTRAHTKKNSSESTDLKF